MRRIARVISVLACALVGACFDGAELTEGLPCDPLNPVCGGDQECVAVSGGSPVCTEVSGCNANDCATACQAQMDACNLNYDCMNLASCVTDCGPGDTYCIDNCRSYLWPNGTDLYDAIASCQLCCAAGGGDTGGEGPGTSTTTGPGTSTTTSTTGPGTSSTTGGPCVGQGSSCLNGETCCDGMSCVSYAEGSDARCELNCSLGSDCGSCCCVPLESMTANVCVEASYCGPDQYCGGACGTPGAICNTDDDCCDPSPYGAICILNAGNWNSCFKVCSTGADCASGCCNYHANSGQYICETCG